MFMGLDIKLQFWTGISKKPSTHKEITVSLALLFLTCLTSIISTPIMQLE